MSCDACTKIPTIEDIQARWEWSKLVAFSDAGFLHPALAGNPNHVFVATYLADEDEVSWIQFIANWEYWTSDLPLADWKQTAPEDPAPPAPKDTPTPTAPDPEFWDRMEAAANSSVTPDDLAKLAEEIANRRNFDAAKIADACNWANQHAISPASPAPTRFEDLDAEGLYNLIIHWVNAAKQEIANQ